MEFLKWLGQVGTIALGGSIGVAILGYLSKAFLEERLRRSFAKFQSELETDAHKTRVRIQRLDTEQAEAGRELHNAVVGAMLTIARGTNEPRLRKPFPDGPPERWFTELEQMVLDSGAEASRVFVEHSTTLPDEVLDAAAEWLAKHHAFVAALHALTMATTEKLVTGDLQELLKAESEDVRLQAIEIDWDTLFKQHINGLIADQERIRGLVRAMSGVIQPNQAP